jgi:hypothetical protein
MYRMMHLRAVTNGQFQDIAEFCVATRRNMRYITVIGDTAAIEFRTENAVDRFFQTHHREQHFFVGQTRSWCGERLWIQKVSRNRQSSQAIDGRVNRWMYSQRIAFGDFEKSG